MAVGWKLPLVGWAQQERRVPPGMAEAKKRSQVVKVVEVVVQVEWVEAVVQVV